jgi:hypothetical protein
MWFLRILTDIMTVRQLYASGPELIADYYRQYWTGIVRDRAGPDPAEPPAYEPSAYWRCSVHD